MSEISDKVKTIKEVLNRKSFSEDDILNMERILGHVDLSNTFTAWTVHNHRIDIKIEKPFVFDAIDLQLQTNKAELAEINKKLDAIFTLMTN